MQTQRRIVRQRRRPPVISARDPRSLALCQGCSFLVQRDTLVEQREYRGGSIPVGTGVYKCRTCLDAPQPYFQKQVLPPDPIPVEKPFPDDGPGTDTFPSYASAGALPSPLSLPAGYQVNVTISSVVTRVYVSGSHWLKYYDNSVVV